MGAFRSSVVTCDACIVKTCDWIFMFMLHLGKVGVNNSLKILVTFSIQEKFAEFPFQYNFNSLNVAWIIYSVTGEDNLI